MIDAPTDSRLWRLTFHTLAGTENAVTVCDVHRRRYASALSALGLAPPAAAPAPTGRIRGQRPGCRNCYRAAAGADA